MAPKRESGSSSRSSTDVLRIGRVGRPHGNDGAFTVAEPTTRLELLDPGRSVAIRDTELKITWRGGTAERPLVKVEETDDRTGAEALRGEAIMVSRAAVGELGPGEYIADDLVGCAVVDGAHAVGTVTDVLLLPAADSLEVTRATGEAVLVPLVSDAVRCVDVGARRIDVDMRFVSPDAD